MQATWTGTGRAYLSGLSASMMDRIEAEVKILFADEIPGHARVTQDGSLLLGLPCGARIRFDRVGDDVRVFQVTTSEVR